MQTKKLLFVLFTLSPTVVLAQLLAQAPAAPNDGPVYNFNFYNKGSIPSNPAIPLAPGGSPAAIIPNQPVIQQTAQQAAPTTPMAPIEQPATPVNFNAFGLFYGYSETKLDGAKSDTLIDSQGTKAKQHLNYSAHEIGMKKTFEGGFSIMPKIMFGKIHEKYNTPQSNNMLKNETSFNGYGLGIDQKLFKNETVSLSLGADYSIVKADIGDSINTLNFEMIKKHTVRIDTLMATLRPEIALSKNFSLSLLGGFGTSRTKDLNDQKYSAKTYRYGGSVIINF